jgi:hypothetical protein
VIDDGVLQHIDVNSDIERSSAHRGHLSEDNVLRDTVTIVSLSHCGSLHENLNGLFEGRPHQGSSVGAVDTMTGDCNKMTAVSHEVAKES